MWSIGDNGRVLALSGDAPRSSEAGALHPALPAVVLLVSLAVFMAAIAPLDFSTVLNRIFPFHPAPLKNPTAVVWVSKTSGTYFCADSLMFGKAEGAYVKQAEALDSGYQPALGVFCNGPEWPIPPQRQADKSASATRPLAGPTADMPAAPQDTLQGTKPLSSKPADPARPDNP